MPFRRPIHRNVVSYFSLRRFPLRYNLGMSTSTSTSRPKAYSYLRMSTDKQLLGDSMRRQLTRSRSYAEKHGLDLVEDDELKDIGLSGFKGENVSKGALGHFLKQIDDGKIPVGSYLLVETFDRLSRQNIGEAMRLFMGIVGAGINLVTLEDEFVYTSNDTDITQFLIPLVKMGLAHDESRRKSDRVGNAWKNKRDNAKFKKLTARCPAWLKLADDRSHFTLIPDKAEIVRRIFDECVSGIGAYATVRRLNDDKIPSLARGRPWQKSSLDKILTNEAAIGLFQPHKKSNGRSVPVGDPIVDYFPAVVEEDVFFRAQKARSSRNRKAAADRKGQTAAGRKGKNVSNLFSGLANCGYCRGRMHYLNKGAGPKGGTFLVCDTANRNAGCTVGLWRYDNFETSFLTFVEELDLAPLALDTEAAAKKLKLEARIESLAGQMADLETKRDVSFEALTAVGGDISYFSKKIKELSDEIDVINIAHASCVAELDALQDDAGRFYESRDQIKGLISKLQGAGDTDSYKLRSQVSARLRSIFDAILLFPMGNVPVIKKSISYFNDESDRLQSKDVLELFQAELDNPNNLRPYFAVMQKDRRTRTVIPSQKDPAKFHEQYLHTDKGLQHIDGDTDVVSEIPILSKITKKDIDNLAKEMSTLWGIGNRSE
jgi:DNA invertase Pin-like site-specific DNA recombinase